MCQAAPLPIVSLLHLVCAIECSGYPSHQVGPSPMKKISVTFMFRTKFYKHMSSNTDLLNSYVLFSHYRSRDIPQKIILLSFYNLCMHIHVQQDENSKD